MLAVSVAERKNFFSFSDVYNAYIECRKRKRNTLNALNYEMKLIDRLKNLQEELNQKCWKPSASVCFITTNPKPREIFAAEFKDRIVHHLLVKEIESYWESVFIENSYACRKNKGTLASVEKVSYYLRKISEQGKKRIWYLQLDIKNFFMSIDKQLLFNFVEKGLMKQFHIPFNRLPLNCKNYDRFIFIRELFHTIIFQNPTDNFKRHSPEEKWNMIKPEKSLFCCEKNKGLPIGNLTSQFFANIYLNQLDQFVKHTLKVSNYVRYVDDFVIISENKEELLYYKSAIESFLKEKLHLSLKDDVRIRPVNCGINFIGYIIRPYYKMPRRRVLNNFSKRLEELKKELEKSSIKVICLEKIMAVTNSYLSFVRHGDGWQNMKEIFLVNKWFFKYFKVKDWKLERKYNRKEVF